MNSTNADQFAEKLERLGPQEPRILYLYFANHIEEYRLRTGHRLWSAEDVKTFLYEVADAMRRREPKDRVGREMETMEKAKVSA